jgi:hypothetical protein
LGLCVVALSRNLKLTTTLDRAITQNPCYVPLNLEIMSKAIKQHLESITVDNLMQFRSEAFASMASSPGRNGSFNLGVNAVGQFVVKSKTETFAFNNPADAIEKYSELVSD